jgi:phage gpG-like protein
VPVVGISRPTELGALLSGLAALGDGKHREELAQATGAEMLALVKRGFDRSEDPYGRPWKSPVLREGKPLQDTGRLKNAFVFQASAEQVMLENSTIYAAAHQYGETVTAKQGKYLVFRTRSKRWYSLAKAVIPRRQMVPEDGVPPLWEERLRAVADKVLQSYLP